VPNTSGVTPEPGQAAPTEGISPGNVGQSPSTEVVAPNNANQTNGINNKPGGPAAPSNLQTVPGTQNPQHNPLPSENVSSTSKGEPATGSTTEQQPVAKPTNHTAHKEQSHSRRAYSSSATPPKKTKRGPIGLIKKLLHKL
jgi:hypothetical protein